MRAMEIKTIMLAISLQILLSLLQVKSAVDLTLQPETNGTLVVQACLAKIAQSSVFSRNDQQMLRRIAYVETHDGADPDTYTNTSNGGIWQLSEAKYTATKNTGSNTQLQQQVQGISNNFSINWLTTQWIDLRKPFYSALAARLYMQVITASIPLASDVSSQGNYWANYYTSSGGNQSQYVSAVNQLQSIEDCDVSALDLFFVMDASGSVGYSNFQTMKTFVRDIANSFEIGPNDVQIGVMSYESFNTFHFYLNTYSTKYAVLSAISALPYSRGGTNTAGALNAVRITGFSQSNGARPASEGIPRVAIVITDGYSNDYSTTVTAANALHNAGIIAFAIGIAGANQNELNAIASQASYVSFISSFNVAQLSALQILISQEACIASSDLSIDQVVSDTIDQGQTKYINYPLPSNDKGITIVLNVSNGSVVLYASTIVSTPSEVFHDVKIESSQFEDVYIDPDKITNPDTADTVYIAIEGQGVSNMIQVSASQGDISTEPVTVCKFPDIVSEYYGQTVIVQCTVRGKPQPTVKWYRKSVLINSFTYPGIQITNTVVDNTTVQSRITITSITDTDEGTYTCSGSNVLPSGTVTDIRSFTLEVSGIIAINFTGIALSSTAIYLSWSLPPVQGVNIQHFIIEIDELETNRDWTFYVVETHATVISLHPYYTYVCKVAAVENKIYPYTSPITVITSEDAPNSAPVITMHYAIDSRTVVFQWDPPPPQHHNGIIREYVVTISIVGSNETQTQTFTGTTAIIGSLIPSFTYQFTVAAYTIATGPYSTSVNITLPEDVPSGFPQDLSVNNITPYSISLKWSPPPPKQQNGAIIHYFVNVTHIDTLETIQYNTTVSSITITGLDPYTTYVCVVSAETTIGVGPFSHLFFVQTKEAAPGSPPQHPSAVALSPTSIHITWDPPILQDHNGVIREYRINVTEALTGLQIQEITNQTQIIIEGLKPHHIYHCSVVAITVASGPFTKTFNVTTLQDATSGVNYAQRGHGRDTALSITMPVLAVIIILVILVSLYIMRTLKRNKKQKEDLIYNDPVCAINPSTQIPIHETVLAVPMRSFTLREDVRTAENEHDIGTTQMNYTNEIEDPKLTDDRNEHNECNDEKA